MKAKLLFIVFTLLCGITGLKAQVMVSESFENAFPPTGWSLYTGPNSFPWQGSTTDPAVNGTRCMKQEYSNAYGSDAWIFSAGYPLTAGINYRLSYWYRTAQSGSVMHFKVTLGRTPTVNGQFGTTLGNFFNVSTIVYTQSAHVFTVPETNVYYFAINSYGLSNNGRLLIDSIVLEQTSGTACTGTLPPGVITGPSQICPDTSFTLTNTGITSAGVGYQWQSSGAGLNNFTNIVGATSNSYTTTQTTSTDYRCIATCFYSGQSSSSNIQTLISPAFCYCTPPTSVCTQSHMSNVTFAGINNISGCGVNGYTDYSSSVAPANVSANTTVPISVTVGSGGLKYVTAWIDYDHNGLFDASEYTQLGNGNGVTLSSSISISPTALPGLTRMRLRLRAGSYAGNPCSSYAPNGGEAEDYAVNITPYSCSGTPAVGTISGITNTCPATNFTLNLSGTYPALNIQWESSPLGANNFTAIAGATATSLTTSQAASTDYRVKVTCVASSLFAYSAIKSVTSPAYCYCPPSNNCTSTYISNVSFASINNSSGCASSGDYTATVAAANITAGTNTALSLTVTAGQNGQAVAWLDMNRNGIFEESEYKLIGTGAGGVITGSYFIPSNTLPGVTRLRVKWLSDGSLPWTTSCFTLNNGETEDYSINILQAPIAMYFTPFADTLYDPSISVTVRIVQRDVGLNATDSLKPRLWAKRQGTNNWKKFKGQLQSGTVNDGNWIFAVNNDTLGTRRNGCDSVQFYFVAQDLNVPSNIGYLPEIGALHTNVQTQVTPPNSLFGYRLKPRMKDTVYVSSSDCRYRSLSRTNGLFQEINSRKLEGDLTVIIESDLQEDAANELTGAGLNGYRLNIRPDGNTLRTLSQNVYRSSLIKLNAVKNVNIDGSYNGAGKFLAITNAIGSSQYTDSLSCVEISNVCDSITLKNIIFRHAAYLINADPPGEHAIYIRGSGSKNIFILNNLFTDVPSAIMSARHIGVKGGNDKIVIRGNEFNNFTRAGIIAFGACQNWIIDSNHFYRTTVPFYPTSNCSAILTRGGGHTITKNYIGGQAPFCAGGKMTFIDNPLGTISGIQVNGPTSAGTVIISNNRVDNIDMNLTVTARANSFAGISAGDNDILVTNNIVGNPASSTATITPLAGGIYGIGTGGTGSIDVKDNIVTSISNKTGNTPDYYNIFITGISKGNGENGYTVFSSPGVVSGNNIYNIHNYNNAYNSADLEAPFTAGIAMSGGANKLIEKNIIHDISCNENAIAGIVYNSGDSASLTTIQQNRIYDLNNTYAFSGHITGIRLNAVRNSVDILNNQITINNNNQASPVNIWGIQETAGIGVYPNSKKRIIYNSIYIGGTTSSAGTSYLYNYSESNVAIDNRTIFNNIFYNERTGGTTGHLAYRVVSTNMNQSLSNTVIDYNFYNLQDSLKFIKWGNTTVQSWTTWRNNNTFDDSSVVSTPVLTPALQLFVDKAQGNLNIDSTKQLCWTVHQKGKPFVNINKDYAASGVRSTDIVNGKTDVGSDEFNTPTPPPGFVALCGGGSGGITSNVTGTNYQWQADTGSGFVNISNGANYSGINSLTLQLLNVPTSWYGYKYRCLVDGSNYSLVQTLVFQNTWLGTVSSAWENPANWSCNALPDGNTDVHILQGPVLVSSNAICRSANVGPGINITIATGQTLTITH